MTVSVMPQRHLASSPAPCSIDGTIVQRGALEKATLVRRGNASTSALFRKASTIFSRDGHGHRPIRVLASHAQETTKGGLTMNRTATILSIAAAFAAGCA